MTWLNDRPILWTVAIEAIGVGAVYYYAEQRTKPASVTAPDGEYLASPEAPPITT